MAPEMMVYRKDGIKFELSFPRLTQSLDNTQSAPLEDVGGQLDFARNALTLNKLGAGAPLRVNGMGH